jgi:hypothetical protein
MGQGTLAIWRLWRIRSNQPVERTAHSAGFLAAPGSVLVGRRSPAAFGFFTGFPLRLVVSVLESAS